MLRLAFRNTNAIRVFPLYCLLCYNRINDVFHLMKEELMRNVPTCPNCGGKLMLRRRTATTNNKVFGKPAAGWDMDTTENNEYVCQECNKTFTQQEKRTYSAGSITEI